MHSPSALFGVLLLAAGSAVNAQEVAPASVPGQATNSVSGLETVIVTAQRRRQAAEDVPISMTVVTGKQLENSHARTFSDMQELVPNFSVSQINGIGTVSIRGVGGGGRNIGFDTRVGVYLDGVYVGQSQALDLPLFDVERVEVLRGPQGHLFGRNTVAGAISITTRAPSETRESAYQVMLGKYGNRGANALVSGPIAKNTFGKISLGYDSSDGFSKNLFDNSKADGSTRAMARARLDFQMSKGLEIALAADYADIKHEAIVGEAMTGMFDAPLPSGPYPHHTINYDRKPYINNVLAGGSITANYNLAGGNVLTAIFGYRSTSQDRENDTDYSPKDVFHIHYLDKFSQLSNEIRIASPLHKKFRYVAGIYFNKENASTNRTATIGNDTDVLVTHPAVPVPVPFGTLLGLAPGAVISNSGTTKTASSAIFGSFDYDFANLLTISMGARYTQEKKRLFYNLDGSASGAVGIATVSGYEDVMRYSMLTPTFAVTFPVNKALKLYANYSRGFKSGGWNFDYLTASQLDNGFNFNKELVNSIELGLKGHSLDRHWQYDLAIYDSRFRDFQISQFVDLGGGTTEIRLRNAARARTNGVEASVRVQVNDNLTLGGNVGISKATFIEFPGGTSTGGDATGKQLPDAPNRTASLTFDYRMPAPQLRGSMNFHSEFNYRSKSYSGVDNIEAMDGLESRILANIRLSFASSDAHYVAGLWARNLFNQHYATARGRDFFGNQFIKRGDPLTIGVDLNYRF
jgi:iron complex outermembrane receptor protein